MKKSDYNTKNTPLEEMTNEEFEKITNSYFEGITYIGKPDYGDRGPIEGPNKLLFMAGGRFPNKNAIQLSQIHEAIDENKLPILIIRKSQNAVIISQEEYKELKETKKTFNKVLDDIGFMKIEYGSKEELVELFATSLKKVLTAKTYGNTFVWRNNNEKRPKE